MRLVIKQADSTINEFQFTEGPIHIGRRSDNQIPLPDPAISKKHAVISTADDGKWMLEDLDSANKTYLNDRAIHKAEIKTGDRIRIADFTIEVNIEDDTRTTKPVDLADTATVTTPTSRDLQIIVRKLGAVKAPPVRFPAERAVDFLQATDAIGKADSIDKVLLALLDIMAKQCMACNVRCAL
jgi:predicted component of type VI protein secretion system